MWSTFLKVSFKLIKLWKKRLCHAIVHTLAQYLQKKYHYNFLACSLNEYSRVPNKRGVWIVGGWENVENLHHKWLFSVTFRPKKVTYAIASYKISSEMSMSKLQKADKFWELLFQIRAISRISEQLSISMLLLYSRIPNKRGVWIVGGWEKCWKFTSQVIFFCHFPTKKNHLRYCFL